MKQRKTASQVEQLVGQLVDWRPPRSTVGIAITCLVIGYRYRYGTWDVALLPVVGSGLAWTDVRTIQLLAEPLTGLSEAGAADLERRAALITAELEGHTVAPE